MAQPHKPDAEARVREVMSQLNVTVKSRVLTDLVGPSYTIVHELEFEGLAAFEQYAKQLMGKPDWRVRYDKFIPYCESGSREIFNIVE